MINREAALALASGGFIVLTQDWHPAHTPHFAQDGGPWPVHCVADSWGSELHPALDVPPGTCIVRKGSNGEDGYSAFTMRDSVTGRRRARRCSSRCSRRWVSRRSSWSGWRPTTASRPRRSTRPGWASRQPCSPMPSRRSTCRQATATGPSMRWSPPACAGRGHARRSRSSGGRRERGTLTAPMIRRRAPPAARLLAVGCRSLRRWIASSPPGAAAPPGRSGCSTSSTPPSSATWAVVADIPLQPALDARDEAGPPPDARARSGRDARRGDRPHPRHRRRPTRSRSPSFEPPTRFAIRHEGLFSGDGVITLEPGADGTTTIVRWDETLVPPFLPELGALAPGPVLRDDLPGRPPPPRAARRDRPADG